MIALLDSPVLNYWSRRGSSAWHNTDLRASSGPMAMLINGYSSSGGDAFPYLLPQTRPRAQLIGKHARGAA